MNMVGHQTTGPDLLLVPYVAFRHQFQIGLVVLIIKKGCRRRLSRWVAWCDIPQVTTLAIRAIWKSNKTAQTLPLIK